MVLFWRKKSKETGEAANWLEIKAPFDGEVVRLDDVPDPVFAQRMVGDGIAVLPTSELLVAPVAGTLTNLFPTGHAAGITTGAGIEVLIHIGMDTVQLKGEGFAKVAQQGQQVEVGTPLIRIQLDLLREKAKSIITPVIVTNMPLVEELLVTDQKTVRAGEDWLLKVKVRQQK
jgi:glucose-specific phosphotransferase system IIA component